MRFLIVIAVIGAASLIAYVGHRFETRAGDREIAAAARESEARSMQRAAEIEAAFQQQLADVYAQAEYFCRYAAHEQGLLLLDDMAERNPMPQRPKSPPPDPGEPWQLNIPDFPPETS